MNYLLDTCVISELIKPSPNSAVVKWISSLDEENFFLSVLTLGEIKKGIFNLKQSKKRIVLDEWYEEMKNRFSTRTLLIDLNVTELWGVSVGRLWAEGLRPSAVDCLIACTAIANGMTVVTRNVRDMEVTGVKVLNPWL